MTGVLWLPEGLELVVLNVIDGELTVDEAHAFRNVLEARISAPVVIVSGMRITVERYE